MNAMIVSRGDLARGPTNSTVASAAGPRHVPAILSIRRAEAVGQKRLLEQRNVDRVEPEKNQRPYEVRPGQEHERLAEQHQDDTRDHRVAHVAVGTPDHELAWWIPRGQGAPTLGDEALEAGYE